MKKSLITLLLTLVCLSGYAYDFKTDGIYYNIVSKDNKTCEVTSDKYQKYSGSLTVPATVIYNEETYQVTSIGNNAFADCRQLETVTIPASVSNIGEYSFYMCNSLKSVNLPEGITAIKQKTFYRCMSLTSVTIPVSVTSIGEAAFRESGITSIALPDNLETIGKEAFYGTKLQTVVIPSGVSELAVSAFAECQELTSVKSAKPLRIGDMAFFLCYNLAEVPVASYVGQAAFASCTALKSITLDESITEISDMAFNRCSELSQITIPGRATLTGSRTFENCSKLKSVNLYWAEPKSINTNLFEGCPEDMIIYVPKGTKSAYLQTPGWMSFSNYEEYDVEPFTSVGTLEVSAEPSAVYNLNGISTPFGRKGIRLLRVGNKTIKVVTQ